MNVALDHNNTVEHKLTMQAPMVPPFAWAVLIFATGHRALSSGLLSCPVDTHEHPPHKSTSLEACRAPKAYDYNVGQSLFSCV